ncbi:MAG: hypothetical protein HY052_01080 [Proteobacteria bacterium]|nr:hypothetical protein [Pseudomonadota bacterium]
MAMVLTGDAAAALAGRKFGKTKAFDKSLEGAFAFFAAALATAAVIAACAPVGNHYVLAVTGAALTAAIAELASSKLRMDDNLSVPLAAGIVMTLLM